MTALVGRELAGDGIVAFTLQPGATVSETFVRNAERFGYDPASGVPLDTSAKVLAAIVTSADPMQYAAQYIDAVTFMNALAG